MRLFVGIPMAQAVVEQLAAVRARLERAGDGLRWSDPDSWHITLQFLGATTPEQYDCVLGKLRTIRAKTVPVQLEGLGFFDRAGVFFAGVQVSPELIALQKSVIEATSPCGFETEDRPYHPHITLARNRGHEDGIRRLKPHAGAAPEFAGFVAREFLLYESFPGPSGSRYEVRARFALGEGLSPSEAGRSIVESSRGVEARWCRGSKSLFRDFIWRSGESSPLRVSASLLNMANPPACCWFSANSCSCPGRSRRRSVNPFCFNALLC